MIEAIIIDDEEHNRSVLKSLLKQYCPLIEIISEASNAHEAYIQINQLKPQLIFLDIRMPGRNGFELLKLFDNINFEVVFVSAFNEYAINAFEFNALGYILKPIDYEKLIKTVDKVVKKIESSDSKNQMIQFISSIDDKNEFIKKITLHHGNDVVLVDIIDIEYIETKVDFCEIKMKNLKKYISSKNLILFEKMLQKFPNFIRISKSVIVNSDTIKKYSKGDLCIIQLISGISFEVSRRKKAEILKILVD